MLPAGLGSIMAVRAQPGMDRVHFLRRGLNEPNVKARRIHHRTFLSVLDQGQHHSRLVAKDREFFRHPDALLSLQSKVLSQESPGLERVIDSEIHVVEDHEETRIPKPK